MRQTGESGVTPSGIDLALCRDRLGGLDSRKTQSVCYVCFVVYGVSFEPTPTPMEERGGECWGGGTQLLHSIPQLLRTNVASTPVKAQQATGKIC